MDPKILYGHAMSQKFPAGKTLLVKQMELNQFINNSQNIDLEGDIGYTLEVDMSIQTNFTIIIMIFYFY